MAWRSLRSLYLLLLLLFGLALAIGVGGTLLAGLNELPTLEAVVAASPLLVLIPSGRLPLLLPFPCCFLCLPNQRRKSGSVQESKPGWNQAIQTLMGLLLLGGGGGHPATLFELLLCFFVLLLRLSRLHFPFLK